MLKDWSGMDKEKAKEYILNCQVGLRKFLMCPAPCYLPFLILISTAMQSYDGGFGMVPGSESHGRQLSQVFVLQLCYWLWVLIV